MKFYKTLKDTVLGLDLRVIKASVYDLLFYATGLAALAVWNRIVIKKLTETQINLADMTPGLVSVAAKSAQDLLLFVIFSFIFFIIVFVLAYSLFRGQMWLCLLKKQMDWAFYWKYSLFNLAWYAGWTLILIAGLLILKPGASAALLVIAVLLMIHFGLVISIEFAKKPGIAAVIHGFQKSIRMQRFIFAYTAIMTGYALILLFGKLLEFLPQQLDTVLFAVFIGMVLAYTSCARAYIINIVK